MWSFVKLNLKTSLFINIALIIVTIVSICTFTIGTEYINFFYSAEKDKREMSEKGTFYNIDFKKPESIKELVGFWKESNDFLVSGEVSLLKDNKRIFLAGITGKIDEGVIPLHKGTFLKHNNKNEALVGFAHKDLIYVEDGQEYIDINNIKLKVVGIIGRNSNSYWNGSILTSLNTLDRLCGNEKMDNMQYIVFSKDDSKNEENRLRQYFNEKFNAIKVKKNITTKGVIEIAKERKEKLISMALLIIVSVVNLSSLAISWYKRNRKNLSVLCLCGYRKSSIMKILIINFSIIILISMTIASGVSLILDKYLFDIFKVFMTFKVENLILGVIFSIIIVGFITLINYKKLIEGKFIEDLRGN